MTARPLSRADDQRWAPAPVRMVHLGLGAFFRAHQAWYTAHASDGAEWGIAAFSGRSTELAGRLQAQEGLYALITRGVDGDAVEVIPSVVAARPGTDTVAWRAALASPEVTVVTLTVTEAAYAPGNRSVAARLVDGLVARRRADAGGVTIVPCDNLPDNGAVLRALLLDEAERRGAAACGGRGGDRDGEGGSGDGGLAAWLDESVAVVSSVVDRITPRFAAADVATAAAAGWDDAVPVVTEPFAEWILSGTSAAPHPDWSSAGARWTDDLTPFTRRKLHLLNGAHSLLAYAGSLRGHRDVADAMDDAALTDALTAWWDEAAGLVGGSAESLDAYRQALVTRFTNPRMHHGLAQIAIDGASKLPVRVVPVARAELAAGRGAGAAASVLGAWVAFVRRAGDGLVDARRDEVLTAAPAGAGTGPDPTRRLVAVLDADLADQTGFVAAVADAARMWGA